MLCGEFLYALVAAYTLRVPRIVKRVVNQNVNVLVAGSRY